MTLTTRISVFFLGTLAAVLVGFSATLYGLARTYLHRQADDRLEAALSVLAATAEVNPDGVEWEPDQRPVSLKTPPGEEPIVWLVRDDRGRVIAGTDDRASGDPLQEDAPSWRVRSRRVSAEIGSAPVGSKEQPTGNGNKEEKYPFLVVTVGLPLHSMEATLRNLLFVLGGLSALLWSAAALAGGRLCRRALAPVRRMAEAAGSMNAADPAQRLPTVATGDELEELNHAFNHLLARLQESFERQRRFTGDASHQLRTPLTAMLGQIEIALRRPRPADEYQQVLAVLHAQTMQLRQIIESLLFLARADAEAKSPQLECLDLRAWLAKHLASWAGHARAADLQMEGTGDGPIWVRAQAPLLSQLVDNLLDNACKYSSAGMSITVNLTVQAGEARLTVADAGSGIAEEDLPHVFEPFYRSPQARRNGVSGVGLGLAVARRIVLALGGTLSVRSRAGEGASFTLRLPIPDDDAEL